MNKNKQKLKCLKELMLINSIDFKTFLISYCGIYNERLFKNKIKHKDIKDLFPNLKRVSFESLIGNVEKIHNGEIISVRDSCGEVLPYINPKIKIDNIDYLEDDCDLIKTGTTKENKKINIDQTLSIEELTLLCKKLKKYKKFEMYREANRVLKNKIHENEYCKVKQYKKKKLNLIVEGRGKNE